MNKREMKLEDLNLADLAALQSNLTSRQSKCRDHFTGDDADSLFICLDAVRIEWENRLNELFQPILKKDLLKKYSHPNNPSLK